MNIKNYTSTVPADRSISNIKKLLMEFGATNFFEQAENGQIVALAFMVVVEGQAFYFKLPANVEAVYQAMINNMARPTEAAKERLKAQSSRTAWKINHEWVHMQLTMIQLNQAELLQVFLPYAYDINEDRTFYEKLKESNFKQITSGQRENTPAIHE